MWGVNYDGEVLYRSGISESTPRGSSWTYVSGHLKQIDTFDSYIIAVDEAHTVFSNIATYSGKYLLYFTLCGILSTTIIIF